MDEHFEAERAFAAWSEELRSADGGVGEDPLHRFRILSYRRYDEHTLMIDIEVMPDYPYANKATDRDVSMIRIRVPLTDEDGKAYILPSVLHQITAFLATGGISEKNIVERMSNGVLVVDWDY